MDHTAIRQIEFQPIEHSDARLREYTSLHRQVWVSCVRAAGTAMPDVVSLKSWMRLWGRLGAELHRCFRNGDQFVRRDMISLARETGGLAGRVLSDRLMQWNNDLARMATSGRRDDARIAERQE